MGEYAQMAIEEGLDQSWGFRRDRYRPRNIICDFCKAERLHWEQLENGDWELQEYDAKSRHYIKHACKFKGRWS